MMSVFFQQKLPEFELLNTALSSTLTSLWMGTRKLILESCIRELAYWSSDTQVRIMKHRRHTLKFTSSAIQC